MACTIAEAARRSGLSAHTLRFYDKEGLLPYVNRDAAGNRIFTEYDFRWLELINCFKKSGMPIKKIKEYLDWSTEGDSTLEIRLKAMEEHKKFIQERIDELEEYMKTIDHKIWYYETAVKAGTEAVHTSYREKQEQISSVAE